MEIKKSTGSSPGSVWLYCPYAAVNDKKYQIQKMGEGVLQHLQKPNPGNYIAKIVWKNGVIPFYAEQQVTIH